MEPAPPYTAAAAPAAAAAPQNAGTLGNTVFRLCIIKSYNRKTAPKEMEAFYQDGRHYVKSFNPANDPNCFMYTGVVHRTVEGAMIELKQWESRPVPHGTVFKIEAFQLAE